MELYISNFPITSSFKTFCLFSLSSNQFGNSYLCFPKMDCMMENDWRILKFRCLAGKSRISSGFPCWHKSQPAGAFLEWKFSPANTTVIRNNWLSKNSVLSELYSSALTFFLKCSLEKCFCVRRCLGVMHFCFVSPCVVKVKNMIVGQWVLSFDSYLFLISMTSVQLCGS